MVKRTVYDPAGGTSDLRTPNEKLRESLPRDEKGDPTLSPELTDAMCGLIQRGNTLANAVRVCGFARMNRVSSWIKIGQAHIDGDVSSPEAEFARRLETAIGDQEATLSEAVMNRAGRDAKLALETLSRRRPEDWAPALPEPIDYGKMFGVMELKEATAEVRRLLAAHDKKDNDGSASNS